MNQFMDNFFQWISQSTILSGPGGAKIIASGLIVIIVFISQKVITRLLKKRSLDIAKKHEWEKTTRYLLVFIGLLLVLRVWFEGFETLLTFLGLVSAGLAIALKDLLVNLAGWIFIVSRHPFHMGDRIQIGDVHGDVIDIRLFQFTVLEIGNWVSSDQSTGRLIHVPNGRVLTEPQANYTQSFKFIWNEIDLSITFESNYKKAKKILENILIEKSHPLKEGAEKEFEEARKTYLIFHGILDSKVYTRVKDNGVCFILRYLVPAKKRRDSELLLWEAILEAFSSEKDIEFAYNTTRFFYRHKEKQQEI